MARPKKVIVAPSNPDEVKVEYSVKMEGIGNETYSWKTRDLKKSFLEFKPPVTVKAKVLFTIENEKTGKIFQVKVLPRMARRYFVNEVFAQVFVNNIERRLV